MTSVMSSRHSPQMNNPMGNEKAVYPDMRLGLFDGTRVGNDWVDYSPYRNDLARVGVTRNDERGMHFDGIDDFYNIPNSDCFHVGENLSVGCWIKIDRFKGFCTSIAKFGSGGSNDSFMLYNKPWWGGGARFLVNTASGQYYPSSNSEVMDGEWHQTIGTFDQGFVVVYVDGVLGDWLMSPAPAVLQTSREVTIGNTAGSVGAYEFAGNISNAFILGATLSENTVSDMYERDRIYYGV